MKSFKELALDFVSGFPWFWNRVSDIPLLRAFFNRLFFINVSHEFSTAATLSAFALGT